MLQYGLVTPKTNTHMQSHERESRFVDALDEHVIARYWKLLAWPVVITLTVLFFAIETTTGFAWWREWILKAVMVLAVTLRVRHEYGDLLAPVLFVNALAGLLLGFGSALLRLVEQFAFYKLFTLFTVPAETVILGVALGWGIFWLSRKLATLKVVKLSPQRQSK